MPQGAKHRFSEKEDRQAQHIIDSELKRGVDEKTARGIAYGHLNNLRNAGVKGGKSGGSRKGV